MVPWLVNTNSLKVNKVSTGSLEFGMKVTYD